MFILCFFALLFSIFSPSFANSYAHQSLDGDIVQIEQEKKNAFTHANYDIYSSQELLSLENLINYVDWVRRADGIDLYNISSQYQRGFSISGSAFFIESSENITPSNIENDGVRFMTIQTFRLTVNAPTVYNANSRSQRFILDFISTTSTTRYLRMTFWRVINNQLSNTATWYTTGLYYYVDGDVTYYASDLALVFKNPTSQTNAWSREFLNYYGLGTDSTVDRYTTGYNYGYSSGYNVGYQAGYEEGQTNGFNYDPVALTIFAGIIEIGLMPINFFLKILNFEVFGINIAGLVSSLLTISIVLIVIRMITGKKNG